MVEYRHFRIIKEIGVEEHEGDLIFSTGNGNTAVSRMRNEKYAEAEGAGLRRRAFGLPVTLMLPVSIF